MKFPLTKKRLLSLRLYTSKFVRGAVQVTLKINCFGCPVVWSIATLDFPSVRCSFGSLCKDWFSLIIVRLVLVFRMIGTIEAKRSSKPKLRKSLRTNIEHPLRKPLRFVACLKKEKEQLTSSHQTKRFHQTLVVHDNTENVSYVKIGYVKLHQLKLLIQLDTSTEEIINREFKLHVYGKQQTSDSSWEFLKCIADKNSSKQFL